MSMDDLYHEIIWDHARYSPYRYSLPKPLWMQHAANPLCGDQVTLFCQQDEEAKITWSFTGQGCAISQASTSLLCEELSGRSMEDARSRMRCLLHLWEQSDLDPQEASWLEALLAIRRFPMRVKCATLSWNLAYQILEQR